MLNVSKIVIFELNFELVDFSSGFSKKNKFWALFGEMKSVFFFLQVTKKSYVHKRAGN